MLFLEIKRSENPAVKGKKGQVAICTIPASTGYGCPRHPYPLVRGTP